MLIKEWLDEHHINYRVYGGKFMIHACAVGDNFYDYGDEPKPIVFDEECKRMENNPLFDIVECCDCCCCASW